MIETNGDEYQGSRYAKWLMASEAKVGKTCFLVAQLLGVFPGQKYGGVVDAPEHLHIVTFDANAFGGVRAFITKTLGAGAAMSKIRVYNMQDDFRRISESKADYDASFYNTIMHTLQKIESAAKSGVHATIISSLTGMAAGIERSIMGPPKETTEKGYADPDKWKRLQGNLAEIQNYAQRDFHHLIWEAHVEKAGGFMGTPATEKIAVSGRSGKNFGFNVEQVGRLRRNYGTPAAPGSKCEQVYIDTRPDMEFISGGRGFTEHLDAKEFDLTLAFHKLGLEIGKWKSKKA